MVLAGVVGSAVLGGCALLALAPTAAAVAVVPLGGVLLSSLPVILELTERRSATSAATALIWLAGNAGGIVVAVAVQATQERPAVAFSLLAATAALVLKEAARAPRTPTA